ncbi:MAG: hypothetical protein AAGN46_13890, partial [Acidobacteriota bacterium]
AVTTTRPPRRRWKLHLARAATFVVALGSTALLWLGGERGTSDAELVPAAETALARSADDSVLMTADFESQDFSGWSSVTGAAEGQSL